MVFPFGVSLSDFVLLIKLVIDTIQGASDIRRARSDFTKLLQSLTSLNGALSFMLALRLDTEARREALESTVANCRTCVEDFLVDVAKFRVLKCEYATKARMIMNLRKIQWALCKKEDVRKFHAELEIHIGALEMLLLTFQIESQIRLTGEMCKARGSLRTLEDKAKGQGRRQKKLVAEVKCAKKACTERLTVIDHAVTSTKSAVKSQSSELIKVRDELRRGLSSEEQHTMFQLVQNICHDNRQLQKNLKDVSNRTDQIERHVCGLKTSIALQRHIPPHLFSDKLPSLRCEDCKFIRKRKTYRDGVVRVKITFQGRYLQGKRAWLRALFQYYPVHDELASAKKTLHSSERATFIVRSVGYKYLCILPKDPQELLYSRLMFCAWFHSTDDIPIPEDGLFKVITLPQVSTFDPFVDGVFTAIRDILRIFIWESNITNSGSEH